MTDCIRMIEMKMFSIQTKQKEILCVCLRQEMAKRVNFWPQHNKEGDDESSLIAMRMLSHWAEKITDKTLQFVTLC